MTDRSSDPWAAGDPPEWLGDVSAVILIAVRTFRLIFHPERVNEAHSLEPVE